jgi:hypothetical protein
MVARITRARFQDGSADQGFAVLQKAVIPVVKQQPGYQGLLLLREPQTGTALLLTLWDANADQARSAPEPYPPQLAQLLPFLAGAPTQEIYEVRDIDG